MISIVMPTYNRKDNLQLSYNAISKEMYTAGLDFELIVVDDGSIDGTKDELRELCFKHKELLGIILNKNYGQQNALLAGIRLSKYPYIVTLDDDLSHDPRSIVLLLKEIRKGYDVVYGVGEFKHPRSYRKFGTFIKEFLFFLLLRKPFKVSLTSFRIMNRNVADYICKDTSPKVYLSARTLKFTDKIHNVPVDYLTKGGNSNYTVWKLIALLINSILNYTWLSYIYRCFNHTIQYEIEEIYQ
jgi:polyisoprenyl-phosphate glycosyltransferase